MNNFLLDKGEDSGSQFKSLPSAAFATRTQHNKNNKKNKDKLTTHENLLNMTRQSFLPPQQPRSKGQTAIHQITKPTHFYIKIQTYRQQIQPLQ